MESIGLEGFFWWFGVVEDRKDPDKLGRVKVRIFNYHGDKVETPTNDLHWASVIVPATSASSNSVGISPNGLNIGSTVFGFFMDGQNGQMPIVFGSLHGIPEKQVSKHDVSNLARENNTLNKVNIGPEPPSAYSAVYPYNKVYTTESGHIVEFDDTPSNERIHVYHKSGSYEEINHEGRRVTKTVNDDIEVIVKNKTVYIEGDCKIIVKGNVDYTVDGNFNLRVRGDVKINGKTINLNSGSQGAARVGDTADTGDSGNPPGSNKIESGSGTVFIGD